MAGLFAVYSIALLFVVFCRRKAAIVFITLGLIMSLLLFWHLATDVLKINW